MDATVALAGNPNSGKTTLFNALTGARQHVGNYPGVTVEKKVGTYRLNGYRFSIVDLPGTYSLTAFSLEEVVARDFLAGENPEVVINILDASNLERNLYLTLQFMEMGLPVCIALNMMDVASNRGIEIDVDALSSALNVPIVPIIARSGKGVPELMQAAGRLAESQNKPISMVISYGDDIDGALMEMEEQITQRNFLTDCYQPRWVALKYLEKDEQVLKQGRCCDPELAERLTRKAGQIGDHLQKTLNTYPEAMVADQRYGYIKSILRQGIIRFKTDQQRLFISDKIDRIVVNRFFGPLIMLAVLLGLYHFTFTYSEVPVGWLGSFFGWLGGLVETHMQDGLLKSLVVSGIIDGVGGVLGFVPLIMFMFFGIAILEDSGYLARVAFMLDRVFRVFGLHGSSVMAYIVSGGIAGGCAVPGVMATRTLKSRRERLATLLTVPFMNCGAKLPVFALLVAAFFHRRQAAMMFGITLAAWAGALLIAKLLRVTVIKGPATPFVMELPPYRLPTFKGLAIHTWERTWQYARKAGTVILGVSILLWAMMTFPGLPDAVRQDFDAQRQAIRAAAPDAVLNRIDAPAAGEALPAPAEAIRAELLAVDGRQAEAALRHSVAGRLGTALESVSLWAGFDWRTNIALIGGFAAKEVIVSTLGTAYSLGEVSAEESLPLSQALARSPVWSPLAAVSAILFIMFYAPCFVSVICITREAGHWKWGLFSIAFNTLLASALATAVFQLGRLLGF
jgi:ferrous iron transport protein B